MPDSPPTHPPAMTASATASGPWTPPVAPWRLYLLILFTFGIYALVWAYRVAQDMRSRGLARSHPGMYSLGMLIPVANLFVFYRQVKQVATLARELAPRDAVLSPGLLLAGYAVLSLSVHFTGKSGYYLALAVSLLLLPLPWLGSQRDLNRAKLRLEDPAWRRPAFRFGLVHYAIMLLGCVGFVGIFLSTSAELDWYRAEPLGASRTIAGASGLYRLRVPDDAWRKVPPGTFGDPDSDLELGRRDLESFLIAYLHKHDSLEDAVLNRVNSLRSAYNTLEYSEERTLQEGRLLPVSLAYYRGSDGINTARWWVATAVLGQRTVEIIGQTGASPRVQRDVEALVRGVEFMGGEEE